MLLAALLTALAAYPSTAATQSQPPSRTKSDAPGASTSRKAATGSKTPATAGTAVPTGAPGTSPTGPTGKSAAAAPGPQAPAKSLVGRISDFVVGNAVWIIVAMVSALAVVIFLVFRGEKRRSESPTSEPQPTSPARPAAQEDGPRRVLVTPGAPKGSAPKESGAEQEYALVVNEEDLKKPPLPEESARDHPRVTDGPLRELLEKNKFEDAYREYQKHLEENGGTEFASELESRLSDHFLRAGDLEKAGRILEHHVATHPGGQISPETYFNLAYIHFKGKTLNKSRRYFRLFADTPHVDPGQAERARKLLARLDKLQNLN